MESADESDVKTIILCHTCCNPLERRFGPVKYRLSSSPDNEYHGTLFDRVYFWCGHCKKSYMSPQECGSDFKQERARKGEYVFVVAPITTPSQVVQIVEWLEE